MSPQAAEVVVEIDDDRHTHHVFLPQGMSSNSPTTLFVGQNQPING
jgi:hypothetical protein